MVRLKYAALLAAALPLIVAGCATSRGEDEGQSIHDQAEEIGSEVQNCLVRSTSFPEYYVLMAHFPSSGPPTLDQLTDRATVTPEDVTALHIAHERAEECRQRELNDLMPLMPTVAEVLARAYRRREDYLVDLIQKKSTWGDYIRNLRDLDGDMREQVMQEQRRVFAGLEQSREAELNRRAAAASAFTDYVQRQQAIDAMNRPAITVPKVTTCNAYGNTATCVTR